MPKLLGAEDIQIQNLSSEPFSYLHYLCLNFLVIPSCLYLEIVYCHTQNFYKIPPLNHRFMCILKLVLFAFNPFFIRILILVLNVF